MSFLARFKQFFAAKNSPTNLQFSELNNANKYVDINDYNAIRWCYNNIGILNICINKLANIYADLNFHIEKNGKTVDKHFLITILSNPNKFQNTKSFLKNIYVEYALFNQFHLLRKSDNLSKIYNNDKTNLEVLKTENLTIRVGNNNNLQYTYFNSNGAYDTYTEAEVFSYFGENIEILNNEICNVENLKPIEKAINIVLSAYEVRIALQLKNGGFGLITQNQSKDEFGNLVEQNEKETERVQESLKKYGYSHKLYNYIVTTGSYNYLPLTYPIQSMDLPQSIRDAQMEICNFFGYPYALINADLSTYNNTSIFEKIIYTQQIVPDWNNLMNFLNTKFQLDKFNERFIIDNSEIESLQPNRLDLITKQNAELNMINFLNSKISAGEIVYEVAKAQLIEICGYSEDLTDKILIKNEEIRVQTDTDIDS
jgi:hypothetical protein